MIVFFDNILVYRKDLQSHIQHLDAVLNILMEHQLYAKKSMCKFTCNEMEYLGHMISKEWIGVYP